MSELKTIGKMFRSVVEKYPEKPALCRKESGAWKPITYRELHNTVLTFSKSLHLLGLRHGDRLAIMLGNSPEWVIADLATISIGAADVPLYGTISDEQAKHILNDSGAKIILIRGDDQVAKLRNIIGSLPEVQVVITVDEGVGAFGSVRTISFASALKLGKEADASAESKVKEAVEKTSPNDLASIIYTSGTTGMPKGVMLSHGNITSNLEAIYKAVDILNSDVHLSFLPLSHVFERTCGYYCLIGVGATINYAESMETIADNIKEIHPTVVISVPRLFEKMLAKIKDKVANGPAVRQKLFYWALGVGVRMTDPDRKESDSLWLQLQFKLASKLVFSKLQEAFGGKIRYFISGGAALNKDVANFFRSIGIKVVEGYGLTETSPVIAVNPPDGIRLGTVGKVLSNLEMKMEEDGELCVRGPSISKGYFNNFEATKEAFDSDGWFHTGDIIELSDDGYVTIVDRKKDIIVMSNGKNVAPLTLESKLVGDDYIAQITVVGNNRKFMAALIVPNFDKLKRFANDQGIANDDNSKLILSPKVVALYQQRIDEHMKDFARFEQVKKFTLLAHEFTEKGGELTPSLKVKRKVIDKKYAEIIDKMYAE
ncbi:MAG: long-chain fatty acid--CoA ligase [Nitrospinota bacterium]|nr:long-chain fatty acid--CoA ligase [Nitrospinota bacterium]